MKRLWLAALLAVSFALRIWLAAEGGQNYWPDESRFGAAQAAAAQLCDGHFRDAAAGLLGHADHVLFRPASLPVALLEHALGGVHPVLVSGYFALFSTGVILLVWAVARRAGAPEGEALWAAFLAAAANTLFIYSRFCLPYDVALFTLMGALWLALGRFSERNSLVTGAAVALGVLTYNGYWLLGAAVLILHTALGDGGRARFLARGACAALSFILVVGLVLGAGRALSGSLLESYGAFAGSIRQGDFHIGYRVIAEYFWYAESRMALLWLAGLAYALLDGFPTYLAARLGWWLLGLTIVLAGLLVLSDAVPVFVVYGRLARQAVPFACLGAAQGISRFLEGRGRSGRPWALGIALTVTCLAAWNFRGPLRQVFPDEFYRMAAREMKLQEGGGYSFYRVLFAETLWGRRLQLNLAPHTDVLRRPNPMQFRPYQYEGYSAEQRERLNRNDISMRLVRFEARLSPPGEPWGGYPGPFRMKVTFEPEFWSATESIVASGQPGKGDILFVRYLDEGHVEFGLDHWGAPLLASGPIKVDLGRPHELIVSAGTMMPPPGSALYASQPELSDLRSRIVVILDGLVVLSRHADFFPSTPGDIHFGYNVIGGSVAPANFTGYVAEFGPTPLDRIERAVPAEAIARRRPSEWAGAVGPLRLRFIMPPPDGGQDVGEPLLSLGGPGAADLVFIVREWSKGVRIGFDRRGDAPLMSELLRTSALGIEEVDLCLGSLLPAAGAPLFERVPEFSRMRGKIYIRFNGERVVFADRSFAPARAEWIAIGANTVGSSASRPSFSGGLASTAPLGPENIPPFGARLADMLDNPDPSWSGFTGPIRLELRFPQGRGGYSEPLLVSGNPGASDAVFVHYDDDSHVRFGLGHSGATPVLSTPVIIEPGAPQELVLCTGALVPPEGSAIFRELPELSRLRSLAEVALNGKPVLVVAQEPHPSGENQVSLGVNAPGDPSCGPKFGGEILALSAARPTEPLEEGALDPRLARTGWGGYPGPLRMRITFPPANPGLGQPILTTGFPGGGDFIYLAWGTDGKARISQDHWGAPILRSEPFDPTPGTEHELTVSLGALFPPPDDALYRGRPDLLELRKRTVLYLDGRRILSAPQESHPTPPGRIILGANLIGGSTAGGIFEGSIAGVAPSSVTPEPP